MGRFLTAPARTEQLPQKGMYKLVDNELYEDDDRSIYLHWRGFKTDNFTWINSSDWDIRCSHGHDIGCKYHQILKVCMSYDELISKGYLYQHKEKWVCKDIPTKYLMVVDVSGHEINNLFYRMLKSADCPVTPKFIQCLYRAGVAFNLNWFLTGKTKIEPCMIYCDAWNKGE